MLTRPARNLADRIAQLLLAIARLAVEKLERNPAAIPLVFRLATLLQRCIRLSEGNLQTPRPAKPTPTRTPSTASLPRLKPLPSQPGWLLQTLPDHAPTLAAELAAILADPAITELLAASPALRRDLSPILVLLALEWPPVPPPQSNPRHNPPPRIPTRHLRPAPPPWAPPPRDPPPGPARPLIYRHP